MCFRTVITYASSVYAHSAPTVLDSLQVIQNKFCRAATDAHRCVRNSILHRDLELPIISQYMKDASKRFFDIAGSHLNALLRAAVDYGPPPSTHYIRRQRKLQDPFTGEEIVKPKVNGELQLRGPGVFKGYFNNAKATNETFTDDGWFRTGDLFFRDEDLNFYFVERFKLLLKYRNHQPSSLFVNSQIAPLELENVIRSHPGVLDVAVAGVPDAECGDLPVACVVRRPGHRLTAQQVKDLVRENLADTKQLRGGVIFLDQLPFTASMKLNRKKINELILSSIRE
ncbi:Luciferin 4-monooxygenase [Eumeta japonica]|uniref:Luciferin 4-monooxygenase n=1 Tax=Eumeta variegata TaxID=151549 RepID=A0A4C1VDM6_EUMVA|nr:Luciferin 4-monooxygenase [Eumeta japonica]